MVVVAVGVVFILAKAGFRRPQNAHRPQSQNVSQPKSSKLSDTLATAAQLQKVIAGLKQGEAYREGGKYLARLEGSGMSYDPSRLHYPDANHYQLYTILVRALIDFADTITPQQMESMKKNRGLRVTALKPDQQKLFSRLQWYACNDIGDR